MPRRISTVLAVEARRLRALGVFNGFVDVDSKLYVDPFDRERRQHPSFRALTTTIAPTSRRYSPCCAPPRQTVTGYSVPQKLYLPFPSVQS